MTDSSEEKHEVCTQVHVTGPLQTAFIGDIRAIVWEYLASATELLRWEHDNTIFPEICAAVRVLEADLPGTQPLTATFAAQFPRLERVIGTFSAEEQTMKFGYATCVNEWAALVNRGVLFDHIVFRDEYEPEVIEENKDDSEDGESVEVEIHGAKLRNELLMQERTQLVDKLLKNKPLNFGFYRELYSGLREEYRELIIIEALFDNGGMSHVYEPYCLATKAGITRLWIGSSTITAENIIRQVRDYAKNGLVVREIGVPRFNRQNRQWRAEERARISDTYAAALALAPTLPPLVFQ